MFYWSYKDIHIVLSDDEEMALVQELGIDSQERIGYHIFKKERKNIERRIFRYLKKSLCDDPETFNRRYVFRSCYGKDAQRMFPILLDAYGRITKRATIGYYGPRLLFDEIVDNVHYTTIGSIFQITLFEREKKRPWAKPKVYGHVSLPASSIEKVAGTVDNFFVVCTAVTIKFHRDFVRIAIMDMNNEQNNFTGINEK